MKILEIEIAKIVGRCARFFLDLPFRNLMRIGPQWVPSIRELDARAHARSNTSSIFLNIQIARIFPSQAIRTAKFRAE